MAKAKDDQPAADLDAAAEAVAPAPDAAAPPADGDATAEAAGAVEPAPDAAAPPAEGDATTEAAGAVAPAPDAAAPSIEGDATAEAETAAAKAASAALKADAKSEAKRLARQGELQPGAFPSAFLIAGHHARRAAWAPGFELIACEAGGRSGQQLKLMTTGSRSGLVEWKPVHMADELMAQDWIVIPAVEPMP